MLLGIEVTTASSLLQSSYHFTKRTSLLLVMLYLRRCLLLLVLLVTLQRNNNNNDSMIVKSRALFVSGLSTPSNDFIGRKSCRRHQQDQQQHHRAELTLRIQNRRDVIENAVATISNTSWATLLLFPGSASSSTMTTTDASLSIIEEECTNGALAKEQAVPGAYQQVCMTLPSRSITIQKLKQLPTSSSNINRVGATIPIELIIQQALPSASLSGSTGTVVWNSSLLLTRLMERIVQIDPYIGIQQQQQHSTPTATRRVLELGCGTGIVSIATTVLFQQENSNVNTNVIATDGNPNVIDLVQKNIQQNSNVLPQQQTATKTGNGNIEAVQMSWGAMNVLDEYMNDIDIVIGSDLTYYSGSWVALAQSMYECIKPKTGIVLYVSLGHDGLNVNSEMNGFLQVATSIGLKPIVMASTTSSTDTTIHDDSIVWTETKLIQVMNSILASSSKDRQIIQDTGGVRTVALHRPR